MERCEKYMVYGTDIKSEATKVLIRLMYRGEKLSDIVAPNLIAQWHYACYLCLSIFILLSACSLCLALLYFVIVYGIKRKHFWRSPLLILFYLFASLDMIAWIVLALEQIYSTSYGNKCYN